MNLFYSTKNEQLSLFLHFKDSDSKRPLQVTLFSTVPHTLYCTITGNNILFITFHKTKANCKYSTPAPPRSSLPH